MPTAFKRGAYLTNGTQLLWVVRRTGGDMLVVENAKTYEQTEVGDADLAGYRRVDVGEPDDNEQPEAGRRREADSS